MMWSGDQEGGMRRRDFLGVISGGVASWPFAAGAQSSQGKVRREIGMLSPFSRSDSEAWRLALGQGLRELGWIEGQNVRIEYRYADGRSERLPGLVADLINQRVEVIVVAVSTDALVAA